MKNDIFNWTMDRKNEPSYKIKKSILEREKALQVGNPTAKEQQRIFARVWSAVRTISGVKE